MSEWLLRGLTDAQRAAVTSDEAPLCVLAGAGSGKTTVLTRRVARRVLDGSADARHILVATFTRKAAAELRGRIARLGVEGGVWAGTLHAAAYRQLRRYWADGAVRAPAILDDPTRLVRKVLTELLGRDGRDDLVVSAPAAGSAGTGGLVGAVAGEVHWAQARLVAPADYPHAARRAGRVVPVSPSTVAEVYNRYREEKRHRGFVDLDDLLCECAFLVETDRDFAAVQRWQIRHVFVDEFQDLNPAQWRLVSAWLGERTDLFVVGDPRQAVYGWNGSDPTLIHRLPELVPGTSIVRLDQNHRSSPQIVSAARAVLGDLEDVADSWSGLADFVSGVGVDGPADGPLPTIEEFDGDQAEALAVVRWLRLAHRPGTTWSSLSVLARTNARLEPVATALREAGIPHRLASAAAPADDQRGLLRETLKQLRSMPSDRPIRSALADIVSGSSSERVADDEDGSSGPGDVVEADVPGPPVPPEVLRLVNEFADEEPGATTAGFLAWVAATDAWSDIQEKVGPKNDRVELATFHKAKGLEWRAVAVVGLEDGLVPIAYASSAEALAEERRLLYVALTRARKELWCSWASTRRDGDRSWACERSPLLDAVEDAVSSAGPSEDPEVRRAHISELRSRLAATR